LPLRHQGTKVVFRLLSSHWHSDFNFDYSAFFLGFQK
jgi:hypothetical protein